MSAGNKNPTLVNSKFHPPYKVFVSSKYRDSEERRKTVQDAITMDEMVWYGMEILSASTRPTVEECLRYAREADLLVGIIARCYGWIPEGSDISITEMTPIGAPHL